MITGQEMCPPVRPPLVAVFFFGEFRLINNTVESRLSRLILALVLTPMLVQSALAVTDNKTDASDAQPQVLAPFYTGAEYEAPAVGSYQLPSLGAAADGAVLTDTAEPSRLYQIMDDKIILLSFIYSTCTDVNGCPLATAVLYDIKKKLDAYPDLRERFRMISLSFDPEYDTPRIMELYGKGLRDSDWRFVTTESQEALKPILDAYRQSVIQDYDDSGKPLPSFSHILRVFLIDPEKQIRNIYSVSFLYPELIINDARTILASSTIPDDHQDDTEQTPYRPGDYKDDYDTVHYRTRSRALQMRSGRPADLVRFVQSPPLGLPPMPIPENNPITREKVALGRKLFFDRRLSMNDTFSCAMCHVPEQGFTSNELAMAVGVEGRSVRRNSPTIYNVGYAERLFHDGREDTLEQQVWSPLLARNEMANPSIGYVLRKIQKMPDYTGAFESVFDGQGPSMETLGMALAAYQRTLNSANSPFDRWHFAKDQEALSDSAKRGFDLFTGKARCVSCHGLDDDHALFTDQRMHNTGIGYRESMGIGPKKKRVNLAPGVFVDVDMELINAVAATPPPDLGLYEITQDPNDRWKYRTPSLRNVSLTAPYMHNGSLGTLKDVVRFYNEGGVPNELLDPLMTPLGLSEQDITDLVAFLESLTGDNIAILVSDGFAAPVGDITIMDPNWTHDNRLGY